jgi:alpha-ketoglutarate-dependent taurine dioxygenase
MAPVDVVPLTTVLGAEVSGVALAPALDAGTVTTLRQALLRHKVLFFRGQILDPASLTGLARLFGEPTEAHPVEPSVEGHPEVLALDADEGARADVWHSDLTFQRCPPMGAMLHAMVVPPVGGDTIWSDMAATYDAMSPTLQGIPRRSDGVPHPGQSGRLLLPTSSRRRQSHADGGSRPMHHPVVRVHPETGRRSLFVNPLFTDKIDGLRRSESDALLGVIQNVPPSNPSASCAGTGGRATWPSGTTGAPCTTHSSSSPVPDA